jgi:hypothetical protein
MRGDDDFCGGENGRSSPRLGAVPFQEMDCFAEPVIGRRFAPTRWLAMTIRKTGIVRGACRRTALYAAHRNSRLANRSACLTIFWRCGLPHFSFRTNTESALLATNRQWFWPRIGLPKGSGNADSQRNVRSSREGGRCRPSRSDSGCVPAHPAPWRASASYLPLRAVWALAPGHSGVVRDHQAPSALRTSAHQLRGIFR